MKTFFELIGKKEPIYEWILANKKNGILPRDLQNSLPDEESEQILMPDLKGIRFTAGLVDNILGQEEDASKLSEELLSLFKNFDSNNEEQAYDIVEKIYDFLLKHQTITYIDEFIALLFEEKDLNLWGKVIFVTQVFLTKGFNKEPIKFSIAMNGFRNLEAEHIEILKNLGLAEEFSLFVAVALSRHDLNDDIFELAKASSGYGRINYIKWLENPNKEMKDWLIYEGYKNDIELSQIALECATKGDLLAHMKVNFDEKLFLACGEILVGLIENYQNESILEYEDAKEVLSLFITSSCNFQMNIEKFYFLSELYFYLADNFAELKFSVEEKDELLEKISKAKNTRQDWKDLILKDIKNYQAKAVSKALGIDIWDEIYNLALNEPCFNDWYELSNTEDISRYKKLCDLAISKLPLEKIASGPADELGLSAEYNPHTNLLFVIQNLDKFDEVMGVELIKTALNSPVVNNRFAALRVIESWKETPKEILNLMEENLSKEPNEDIKESFLKILDIN